jgi:hypothetical protein
MSGILEKRVSTTQQTTINVLPTKSGRGRPKGSKNKPKALSLYLETATEPPKAKGRRGRPKGAKNKPKIPQAEPVVKGKRGRPKGAKNKPREPAPSTLEPAVSRKIVVNKKDNIVTAAIQSLEAVQDNHPLLVAVKWLEKNMHPTEVQYYRGRANKTGVSLHVAMASDLLGFFNVQNPEICKQIKKNNFIATSSNVLH